MAVAASLATLSFLRLWSDLLADSGPGYFDRTAPSAPALWAVICNTCLATVLLFPLAAQGWWTRNGRRAQPARAVFLLALLAPLNALRIVLSDCFEPLQRYLRYPLFSLLGQGAIAALGLTLAVLVLVVLHRWSRQAMRFAAHALLVLFPLTPLVMVQGLWRIWRAATAPPRAERLAGPLPGAVPPARRALWMIFDELDYRLAFPQRPPGLRLPELDRLAQESLDASAAVPPAADTLASMPALLSGLPVVAARPSRADLLLTLAPDRRTVPWSRQDNVFSRARREGFNTAVAGWYHPYCRTLAPWLAACAGCGIETLRNSLGTRFLEILPNQLRVVLETSQFSPFGQSLMTRQHRQSYEEIRAAALRMAADPSLGLVLVHWPVPHAPFFYDRRKQQTVLSNSPINGYVDSLELVDRSLGDVRRAMETAGVWGSTMVLVSADHSFRSSQALDGKRDRRVPFLFKLAGQSGCAHYERPLNTRLSGDLILDALRGELSTASETVRWLERRRTN